MAIKRKRDFKKLSVCIQEFLSKLPCEENTGFLRDTLYLSLLELHKYYVKEKEKLGSSLQHSNGKEILSLKHSGQFHHGAMDKYERRWFGYNGESKEIESQGFAAALRGDIEKLKDIVCADDVDTFGQTYLMYAVHNQSTNQAKCLEYLLSLNFDINSQANDGSTALHVACQYGQKQSVITLLKNEADPKIQDNKGRTALHWAAIKSSSDLVKILLQHGADIYTKDCDGMPPVMWACYMNQPNNLHLLKNALERLPGPQPLAIFEDRDNEGRTVLDWAVATRDNHDLQCLKALLGDDASHIKNKEGRTVLHSAAQQGCVSACELILSACGKEILHGRDHKNQTALHLATLCGHGEIVDCLLRFGANMSDMNDSGRTALDEAQFGHYHYCLLVFAAFEQMKMSTEKNKPVEQMPESNEKNDMKANRYDSWVIPTGFLHDSQEIPDTPVKNDNPDDEIESKQSNSKPPEVVGNQEPNKSPRRRRRKQERHHANESSFPEENMDVARIKGFEEERVTASRTTNIHTEKTHIISRENTRETQDNSKEKPKGNANESRLSLKSSKTGTLQRSLGFDEEKPVGKQLQKQTVVAEENKNLEDGEKNACEKVELKNRDEKGKTDDKAIKNEQRESPLSSSELENESISENIEVSSLDNEVDTQSEESSDNKAEEVDSANEDSEREDLSEGKEKSKVKLPDTKENHNFPEAKVRRGNLEPLTNPLAQRGLSIPSKLDPIPLYVMNKRGLSSEGSPPVSARGIVAPLQPPPMKENQNDHLPISPPHGSSSMYGTRGPGHGPLAHAQGKALLTGIFQDTSRSQEQKTPETKRKNIKDNKSGKLTHRPKIY